MAPQQPDAIFLKLGVLEVSAFGQLAIVAVVVVALLLFWKGPRSRT